MVWAGLGFDDGVAQPLPLPQRGAHARVQMHVYPGLRAQGVQQQLHLLHLVLACRLSLGRHGARPPVLQPRQDLGHDATLVLGVDDAAEHACRPDAAKASVHLHQTGPGPGPGRSQSRRHASGSPTAHQHLVLCHHGDGSG